MAGGLEGGRAAFGRGRWGEAYEQLSSAAAEGGLGADDVETLAVAAYLTGRDDESCDLWAQAHHQSLHAGDIEAAVRCASWLALTLLLRGDPARSAAWRARGQRVVADAGIECGPEAVLLLSEALPALFGGDPARALPQFSRVVTAGERFEDHDAIAMGRLGIGQCHVAVGRLSEGAALLDEAMVEITGGRVSPIVVGIVYCAVLVTCQDMFDVRRAREWTDSVSRWCESQPDLVAYRGECLVHRAELLELQGQWATATAEAELACDWLAGRPSVGMAHYQHGELLRLRGEFAQAEESYRRASRHGRDPQPGLSLLRLAQGSVDAAVTSIRRVLDGTGDRAKRMRVLPACVEIMLAAGDVTAARAAADELKLAATEIPAEFVAAVAAHADGATLLAEGRAHAACEALSTACAAWRNLDVPYNMARTRVLLALAYRMLADNDAAQLEFAAAHDGFDALGAVTDCARVAELASPASAVPIAGLTGRELQVLALVATGRNNREIAEELSISDHTVRRHLQNIFAKAGVSSRAAATAFAFHHDLV